MGTASRVRPGSEHLSADEAVGTLRRREWWALARDAFVRFRYADGFSHARALAFQVVLALVPFTIAVVGLAGSLHGGPVGRLVAAVIERMVPEPSSDLVREVLDRGREHTGGTFALWFGALFALANLVTAMSQIERGANRIYGIERDRPFDRKYGRSLLMAAGAGLPLGAGFLVLVAGPQLAAAADEVFGLGPRTATAWTLLRWPVGVLLTLTSAAVIFRRAPRRRQPGYSWLAFGAGLYLVLWLAATWLLSLYLRLSGSFDAVYGPLSAVFSLLVWAYLTAIALFLGLSFAAQLEAVRTARPGPIRPDPLAPSEQGSEQGSEHESEQGSEPGEEDR
ncbi:MULTISPECIES: YihY/virulence factor BrkB family protein [Kitasatospora]|uniref:Putative ribonuclease n=1 Tax=Kitasatospora setae (strain ATCC 33774 / DSM 43861 / JCM 3304 / KCC A-0304 / NBRC 14216 / KM-6054) TaxID=452652 RepID=E4N587_KITSK|nr:MULTISPECIES: YihY/virulence factor BrkB family protein [Kitasatospora]BAJ26368.1 putative ribonuclease [Kitasatospora setae KM-6054]